MIQGGIGSQWLRLWCLAALGLVCLSLPQRYHDQTLYYPHPYFEYLPAPIFPCAGQPACWMDMMNMRRREMYSAEMTTPDPTVKRSGSEIINAMKSLPRDMVLNGR